MPPKSDTQLTACLPCPWRTFSLQDHQEYEHLLSPGTEMFFVYIGISAALVSFAGIFSGLTLGRFSRGPGRVPVDT